VALDDLRHLCRMTSALTDAYETCLRLARSHYENFPVASWLLPARLRPHIAAVYAFARIADDFADEPGLSDGARLAHLADWERRLLSATGPPAPDRGPSSFGADNRADEQADAVFLAVHDTIQRFDLPIDLFSDLLSAFRQDVILTRYSTWGEVLDYCRRSANPVGRLVLRVFGYRRDELDAASDAFCTALQLTNFWQDLASDWSRGRLYVPEEIWRRHSADPSALSTGRLNHAWRLALEDAGRRTRRLFDEGRSVCDGVGGRLRYELRATWLGGTRVLDRLERSGFEVFDQRPTLGAGDAIMIGWGTAAWRSRRSKKPEA
jgi:hydroxysqualene synthase